MSTSIEESITSNREETDTKVILHNHQILKSNEASIKITKRSPLGDTDIVVLTVALLYEFHNKALIDVGSEDNRKVMQLRNIDIEKGLVNALIGFHAFTGNYYISSFFLKGKKMLEIGWKNKNVPEYIFNSGEKLGSWQ